VTTPLDRMLSLIEMNNSSRSAVLLMLVLLLTITLTFTTTLLQSLSNLNRRRIVYILDRAPPPFVLRWLLIP